MQGGLWQPGWLELLRKKRGQGLSCGKIAEEMSAELHVTFTRNSIIGKLNRERIPAPGKLTAQRPENRLTRQHRLDWKSKEVAMPTTSSPPPSTTTTPSPTALTLVLSPPPPTATTPTPSPELPCLLVDLPDDGCRWPVNEPASWRERHLFCGLPATRRMPHYCEAHYEVSVQRVRLRELAAPAD